MIDQNVGKLAKSLRLLGFDAIHFNGENDTQMVNIALAEDRIILTRDTHILKRKVVTNGKVKAILVKSDSIDDQTKQIIGEFNLRPQIKPFTLCLEDNSQLIPRSKEEVIDMVPPYVWQTKKEYMECPRCHRLYWRGTHWEAMTKRLKHIVENKPENI